MTKQVAWSEFYHLGSHAKAEDGDITRVKVRLESADLANPESKVCLRCKLAVRHNSNSKYRLSTQWATKAFKSIKMGVIRYYSANVDLDKMCFFAARAPTQKLYF